MNDRTLSAVRHDHPGGVTVLAVNGELDYHNAGQLTQIVDGLPFGPGTPVVIDLSELHFCDSTGLTVFVQAYQRAKLTDTRLILAAVDANLSRVLHTTGLDQLFTFEPTVADALAQLKP